MTDASEYNLENDVYRLLSSEPFFAALSRCVNKHASDSLPTAGVRVSEDGHFDLAYNRKFMASLTDVQKVGILKHEFYHLIFEHVTSRNPDDKMISRMWNVATDLSINCHIPDELPEGGLFPKKFGFPDYLSAEQYMRLLEDKYPPDEGDKGDGEGMPGDSLDDHEGWGDGELSDDAREAARAIARERLREACKQGVEEAARKSGGFGNMHDSIRERIIQFVNGTVDWRAVLRNFIGQSQRTNRSNTVKRINKRFPYIHAGRKTDRAAHIAVAIDQSGSVDDGMLALFFGELSKLSKLVTFTVVPFDTRVDDKLVYQWRKGEKHPTRRVMQGGTCFNAPTEWVNAHPEIDGLIIATDMQAPAPVPCRVRRLWVTDKANKKNPYFKTNELVIAAGDK
jgi:predicted metal-dependent peptidase